MEPSLAHEKFPLIQEVVVAHGILPVLRQPAPAMLPMAKVIKTNRKGESGTRIRPDARNFNNRASKIGLRLKSVMKSLAKKLAGLSQAPIGRGIKLRLTRFVIVQNSLMGRHLL